MSEQADQLYGDAPWTRSETAMSQAQAETARQLQVAAVELNKGVRSFADAMLRATTSNGLTMTGGAMNPLGVPAMMGIAHMRGMLTGQDPRALMAGIHQATATGAFDMRGLAGGPLSLSGHGDMVKNMSKHMYTAVQDHFMDSSGRMKAATAGSLNMRDMGALFQQISGVGGFKSPTFELGADGGLAPNEQQTGEVKKTLEKWAKTMDVMKKTFQGKEMGELVRMLTDMTGSPVGVGDPSSLRSKLESIALAGEAGYNSREYAFRHVHASSILASTGLARLYGGNPSDHQQLGHSIGYQASRGAFARKMSGQAGDTRFRTLSDEEHSAIAINNATKIAGENDEIVGALLVMQEGDLDARQKEGLEKRISAVSNASTREEFDRAKAALASYTTGTGTAMAGLLGSYSSERKRFLLTSESNDRLGKEAMRQNDKRDRWLWGDDTTSMALGSLMDSEGNVELAAGLHEVFGLQNEKQVKEMIALADNPSGLAQYFQDNKGAFAASGVDAARITALANGMAPGELADFLKKTGTYASTSGRFDGSRTGYATVEEQKKMASEMMKRNRSGGGRADTRGMGGLIEDFLEGALGLPPASKMTETDILAAMSVSEVEGIIGAENGAFNADQLEKIQELAGGDLLKDMGALDFADAAAMLTGGIVDSTGGGAFAAYLDKQGMVTGSSGDRFYTTQRETLDKHAKEMQDKAAAFERKKMSGSSLTFEEFSRNYDRGLAPNEAREKELGAIIGKYMPGGGKDPNNARDFAQLKHLNDLESGGVAEALQIQIDSKNADIRDESLSPEEVSTLQGEIGNLEKLRDKLGGSGNVTGRLVISNFRDMLLEVLGDMGLNPSAAPVPP